MPPPACKNPTLQAFNWPWQLIAHAPTAVPSLNFVGDTLSVSVLIGLETLTFDLLTSNLELVIARGVVNLPTDFGVSGTFRSQHLSD